MTLAGNMRIDCLLIVRLNNYLSIKAAYGEKAAALALDHLRRMLTRHLGGMELIGVRDGEIELRAQQGRLHDQPGGSFADTLCRLLTGEPFRHGDSDILLSVSMGYSLERNEDSDGSDARRRTALARLAASSLQHERMVQRSEAALALYRKDMAQAAALLKQLRRRAAFFTWRPIVSPGDTDAVLYYEAVLRCAGLGGEQIDCSAGYAALERIGLAHVVDRQLVADVLDELDADPAACLSVAISAQSLSLNLHGQDAGWNDLFARLRRDRRLSRRLVLEIAETSSITSLQDARAFVALLRELGVRISVARFGSGFASIGQLMALSPDVVKIDSPFMHTAYRSDVNRARLNHLLGLARTISRTVIVDGVESAWHLHLAIEQRADWVAGSHLGRPSIRRSWLDAGYGETVSALAAYQTIFHHGVHPSLPAE